MTIDIKILLISQSLPIMASSKGAMNRAELQITGMTCAACSGTIERMFRAEDGIAKADVNLMMATAVVEYEIGVHKNAEALCEVYT